MKNIFNHPNAIQRVILLILFLGLLISIPVVAQKTRDCLHYLDKGLPRGLEINNKHPQQYLMVTDYVNKDIFGNFFNKFRVSGTYTRGLEEDQVSWAGVSIAESMVQDSDFSEGTPIPFMEGFTYVPSEKMMLEESFPGFSVHTIYAKNLVWDMMAFEAFAWAYFDSLRLNEEFFAREMNQKIDLEGEGYFENKDIRLRWTGISQMNDKLCAVIEYITMDNPLGLKNEMFEMKGRSHYWGTIWVSIEDKHIEHGVMHEDVMMEMKMPSQPGPQMINATREIVITKVNAQL